MKLVVESITPATSTFPAGRCRDRQVDTYFEAAGGERDGGHRSAVGNRDRSDDRQAQT